MTRRCPYCKKAILEFKPTIMTGDEEEELPVILLAETHCPSCGWRPAFGRFKTEDEALASVIPKQTPLPLTGT